MLKVRLYCIYLLLFFFLGGGGGDKRQQLNYFEGYIIHFESNHSLHEFFFLQMAPDIRRMLDHNSFQPGEEKKMYPRLSFIFYVFLGRQPDSLRRQLVSWEPEGRYHYSKCSVENQKGAIAIHFVQRQRPSGSQRNIFKY